MDTSSDGLTFINELAEDIVCIIICAILYFGVRDDYELIVDS